VPGGDDYARPPEPGDRVQRARQLGCDRHHPRRPPQDLFDIGERRRQQPLAAMGTLEIRV
jgi:hypothetical protein